MECIFCKMSLGEIPVDKIYENDNFFSIKDMNQKIPGHSLVISKKHFEHSLDLPSSLGIDFFDAVKNTSRGLMEEYSAGGFNVVGNNFGASGQEVMHFHFHILPRKKGDGIKLFD